MLNESPTIEYTTGDHPRILVVEDDPQISELLESHLNYSLSAELRVAACGKQALELDDQQPAEVVLVDYMLPDMDGLELIAALNQRRHRPTIIMTGHPTLGRAIEAMRLGAADMFVKPFDLDKMTRTVYGAIEKHRHDQVRLQRLTRMRSLVQLAIRDRRGLRRKMDLLCRDMVVGYRELTEKVNRFQNRGK